MHALLLTHPDLFWKHDYFMMEQTQTAVTQLDYTTPIKEILLLLFVSQPLSISKNRRDPFILFYPFK